MQLRVAHLYWSSSTVAACGYVRSKEAASATRIDKVTQVDKCTKCLPFQV